MRLASTDAISIGPMPSSCLSVASMIDRTDSTAASNGGASWDSLVRLYSASAVRSSAYIVHERSWGWSRMRTDEKNGGNFAKSRICQWGPEGCLSYLGIDAENVASLATPAIVPTSMFAPR